MTNTTTLNSINKDFFSFKEDLDYLYYPNISAYVDNEDYENNSFLINKLINTGLAEKFFCEFAIKTYSLEEYKNWDKLSLDQKTSILSEYKEKLSIHIANVDNIDNTSFFDNDEPIKPAEPVTRILFIFILFILKIIFFTDFSPHFVVRSYHIAYIKFFLNP